jgi:hypothetical protein
MVPLHAAFTRAYAAGQAEFADQFARFLAAGADASRSSDTELTWFHYLYLCSRFLVLSAETGRQDLVPAGLADRLRESIAERWLSVPSWQWGRSPFRHGMRERVRWKLTHPVPGLLGHNYYRAIISDEIFEFAIAADLRRWERLSGRRAPQDSVLDDILSTALEAVQQRVIWVSGSRWLFQPGVWTDHPDFAYACRTKKVSAMLTCRVRDVAEDASHSHQSALWLRSLAGAYDDAAPEHRYYDLLRSALERQFFSVVAVAPDGQFAGWRTRNFMDGRNGVYRWGYATLGEGQGYGPYELSGTLLLGWWAFLGGPRAHLLYDALAAGFPLGRDELRLYAGPFPLGQEKGAMSSGFLTGGWAELISRLAADLTRAGTPRVRTVSVPFQGR